MSSLYESSHKARAQLQPCAALIACGFALLACSPKSPTAQLSPTGQSERLAVGEETDPNSLDPNDPNAAEPAAADPGATTDSEVPLVDASTPDATDASTPAAGDAATDGEPNTSPPTMADAGTLDAGDATPDGSAPTGSDASAGDPDAGMLPPTSPTGSATVLEDLHNRSLSDGTAAPAGESLAEYTDACQKAVGMVLPATMNCDVGTDVPGQEADANGLCATPNVLNTECDPGSRFQVLAKSASDSADATAVMHCRKRGNAEHYYGDIAIIMTNKSNGATCFFQALNMLRGDAIPSPAMGEHAWSWMDPQTTADTKCTGCHDNGPFIRSPYLAQLGLLPSTEEGFANDGTNPLRYVGKSFSNKNSWIITAPTPDCVAGQNCDACNTCHVLAVNNSLGSVLTREMDGTIDGTGWGSSLDLGIRATDKQQTSKLPHSTVSPIWMRPGQILFEQHGSDAAHRYQACAADFVDNNFLKSTLPGCSATPYGRPWQASDATTP